MDGLAMNPETLLAIIAYAIGMVYICRRYR
nr:MAG TPA: hypothetical protein [Caudoviricetes sp.]